MSAPVSRCSERSPIEYVWAAGPGSKSHIEAAVDALMNTLRGDGRQWGPYNEPLARTEFRRRLEAAERGELEPVDEVDDLKTGTAGWLYEIRWSGISVRYLDEEGKPAYYDAEVRAIHGEPPRLPMHVIGVHVHEKVWWNDDPARTEAAQNAEIQLAVGKFWGLEPSNWGLV
ncbi:hypothetical protein [Curtobacterium sp. VKM Ac-1395]|uniref:hypothetical protein n=1 Tax=Curtobacterium sp. VKM Ac-1395 TaxID=2783815 RepID=UPI00188C1C0C|nr:hypothetical protein [Curtobacterium sp. VKM Ac-1395]MBF4591258.1 hypothetical protein [Curtobacterium sp. VKM Ac-1395]